MWWVVAVKGKKYAPRLSEGKEQAWNRCVRGDTFASRQVNIQVVSFIAAGSDGGL